MTDVCFITYAHSVPKRKVKVSARLSASLGLAFLLAFAGLAPAEAADPPVTIQWLTPDQVEHPAIDDPRSPGNAGLHAGYQLSRSANVTLQARNGSGTVVRTLATNVSTNGGAYGSYFWDFRGGLVNSALPSGDYDLRMTATDSAGNTAVAVLRTPLDRETAIPLRGVTSGQTVSGPLPVSIAPAAGVHLISARFVIGVDYAATTCAVTPTMFPDASGEIRGTIDTADCGDYTGNAWAQFTWKDALGTEHTGYTAHVPVTVDDNTAPVVLWQTTTGPSMYLTNPDNFTSSDIAYQVDETGGLSSATWRVTDHTGLQVSSGTMLLTGPGHEVRWTGRRANGTLVPSGSYTLHARFVDRGGNATDAAAVPITVDATVPGTLAVEPAGTNRWTAVVRVTSGVDVTGLRLERPATGAAFTWDAATSTWRAPIDLTGTPAGTTYVQARITRTAPGRLQPTTDYLTATTAIQVVDTPDTTPPVVTAPPLQRMWFSDPDTYTPVETVFDVQDETYTTHAGFRIVDASGETVRTAYGDTLTWDGYVTGGQRAPGGTYRLVTTWTDAAGNSTTASATIVVEPAPPASLDVTQDTARPGWFRAVVTPRTGADVRTASLVVGYTTYPTTYDVTSGAWVAAIDGRTLAEGSHEARADITRGTPDSRTATGYFNTRATFTVSDVAAPVVTSPAGTTSYLLSPGRYEGTGLSFGVSDASPVTGTAWVTDAAGAVVRSAWPVTQSTGGPVSVSWDGTGTDGSLRPGGTYAVHLRITDASGNTATATPVSVVLDARTPGMLLRPAAGETMRGASPVEYRPASAWADRPMRVDVCLDATTRCEWGAALNNASADGIWRTTWPVGTIPAGTYPLRWTLHWVDVSGRHHSYEGAPRTVTVDPTTVPVDLTAAAPGGLTTSVAVEASNPRDQALTTTIDWGDGSTTGPVTAATPAGVSRRSWQHTYQRAGTYVATVEVEGATATTETATLTAVAPPGVPGAVTAKPGNQTITVGWAAPATGPVTTYQVAWLRLGARTWSTHTVTGTRSLVLSGLANGAPYAVAVRAGNSAGWGAFSPARSATPDARPPRPSSVTGAPRSRAALVSWTAGTVTATQGRPTAFVVQRYRPSDGVWVAVKQVTASARSALVTNLRPGTAYRFRVRARNAVGYSPASTAVRVVPRA